MAIDPVIVNHRFYWLWICHQPDKASGPLITHKEKRKQKESLSRGNSIALVLFLFFLSLFLAFRIFCLFAFFFCFKRLERFPFDLQVFKHRRY